MKSKQTSSNNSKASFQKTIFIPIEGNIGAGKTTFTRVLQQHFPYDFQLIPEPVSAWQKVGDSDVNMLDLMYQNPERWGYTFQSYAFFSRLKLWQESKQLSKVPVVFFERSVFSDKHIFALNFYKSGLMKEAEWAVYNEWYNYLTKLIGEESDGFIYLRTTPRTCLNRLKKRARSEEKTIELEYLQQIHDRHEEWLNTKGSIEKLNVLALDCDAEFEKNPERQKDMVDLITRFVDNIKNSNETEDKENKNIN